MSCFPHQSFNIFIYLYPYSSWSLILFLGCNLLTVMTLICPWFSQWWLFQDGFCVSDTCASFLSTPLNSETQQDIPELFCTLPAQP